MIKFYQKTLSPDHGPLSFLYSEGFCRFQPTCSEYTRRAVEKYGVSLGTFSGLWRILRCHPFSKGGLEPVPPKKEIKKLALKGFLGLLILLGFVYFSALILKSFLGR